MSASVYNTIVFEVYPIKCTLRSLTWIWSSLAPQCVLKTIINFMYIQTFFFFTKFVITRQISDLLESTKQTLNRSPPKTLMCFLKNYDSLLCQNRVALEVYLLAILRTFQTTLFFWFGKFCIELILYVYNDQIMLRWQTIRS